MTESDLLHNHKMNEAHNISETLLFDHVRYVKRLTAQKIVRSLSSFSDADDSGQAVDF